jgi:single-strand DNA-binding protein
MFSPNNFSDQTGYLGADPESRNTDNGKVVSFQVATTKKYKDSKTGERKETTFWRRYEAWNEMGDNITKFLKSGSKVRIISEPSNNEYADKDHADVKHYQERHVVRWWQALDPKDGQEAGGGEEQAS